MPSRPSASETTAIGRLMSSVPAELADHRIDGRHDRIRLLAVRRRHKEVPDREARVIRQRRIEAERREVARPERTRNIGEDAAAVALAVDLAGAVVHRRERMQDARHILARRHAVPLDHRHEAAGIVLGRPDIQCRYQSVDQMEC